MRMAWIPLDASDEEAVDLLFSLADPESGDVAKAWGRKATQNRRRQVRQLKAKRGKWYRR